MGNYCPDDSCRPSCDAGIDVGARPCSERSASPAEPRPFYCVDRGLEGWSTRGEIILNHRLRRMSRLQFILGFTAAVLVLLFIVLLQIPFSHRAKTPERFAHLISELYYRGEAGSYANVTYKQGKAAGGHIRISKVIEALNDVKLVISVPADARDERLTNWAGAGKSHREPESATSALLSLLTDTLGADLRRVFIVYRGLSPASDSIGWSNDARRHR